MVFYLRSLYTIPVLNTLDIPLQVSSVRGTNETYIIEHTVDLMKLTLDLIKFTYFAILINNTRT